MIKSEQIPDVVIGAARKAWLVSDDGAVNDWRKAVAAAINAWPGADKEHAGVCCNPKGSIILPLPQEPKND